MSNRGNTWSIHSLSHEISLNAKSEAKFSNIFSSDVSLVTLCVACVLKWEIFLSFLIKKHREILESHVSIFEATKN